MSDADQAAVLKALQDTAGWVTEQIVQSEAELVDWFKGQGVNVNEVDRKPFMDMVKPALLADDLPFSNEIYERLQAIPDAS